MGFRFLRQLRRDPREIFLDRADRSGILRHQRIGGKERNALYGGLRNQDPVKRVFVNGRQALGGDHVIAADRQFTVAIV